MLVTMMKPTFVLLVLTAAFAAAGCGSEVLVQDDGGETGGSTGTGATGTGGSGNAGNAGGTGNVGAACSEFLDESTDDTVTVRFINDSGTDIYLPAICGAVRYSVYPAFGMDPVDYNYDKTCFQTCEHVVTGEPVACADCAATSILLPSGGVFETEWAGVGLDPGYEIPAECVAGGGVSSASCDKLVAAAAAEYYIDVVGYSGCGPNCECDGAGVCSGNAEGAEAYPDFASFELPGDDTVDVLFGICAFPCPG